MKGGKKAVYLLFEEKLVASYGVVLEEVDVIVVVAVVAGAVAVVVGNQLPCRSGCSVYENGLHHHPNLR